MEDRAYTYDHLIVDGVWKDTDVLGLKHSKKACLPLTNYHQSFEIARSIQPGEKVVFVESDPVGKHHFWQVYNNMKNNLTEAKFEYVPAKIIEVEKS